MSFNDIIRTVKDAIDGDDDNNRNVPRQQANNQGGLLGGLLGGESPLDAIKDIFTGNDNQQNVNGPGYNPNNVRPASEDPLGDPADQERGGYQNAGYVNPNQGQFGNVLPASQDPLGDPADQEAGFGNVRPASEDPLGDPADQERGGYRR